jgi:hypothetical protein
MTSGVGLIRLVRLARRCRMRLTWVFFRPGVVAPILLNGRAPLPKKTGSKNLRISLGFFNSGSFRGAFWFSHGFQDVTHFDLGPWRIKSSPFLKYPPSRSSIKVIHGVLWCRRTETKCRGLAGEGQFVVRMGLS